MNINPIATAGVKAPDIQPYIPPEIEGDNLSLRSDQVVPIISDAVLAEINDKLKPHSIRFEMEDDKAVMKVIDSNDNVIREIPDDHIAETVSRMKDAIQTGKNLGILLDEFV